MAIRRADPYPLIKTGNSDSFPSGPTGFSKSNAFPPSADFDSRSAAAAISNSVLAGSRIRSSSLSFSSLLTHSVEESYAMEPRTLPHFPLQTSSPSAYPFIPISSPISYIQDPISNIQPATSKACFLKSANFTCSNADSCVASSTTSGALPASLASSQRAAQTHHRSPGLKPGK